MFRNYLIITLRNLLSNAFYAFINIIGLALALAVCIVAYINNKYNYDFDVQHENADQIYKIGINRSIQARIQQYGFTPIALGPLIESNVSGIESVVRIARSYSPVKVGENNFNKRIAYVDKDFFSMFTLKIVRGTADNLSDGNTILINEELAGIYFGDKNPVGEIISIFNDNGKEYTFMVAGVYADFPLNSSFNFQAITLYDNFIEMWRIPENDWRYWTAGTFVMIPERGQETNVERMLQQFVEVQNKASETFRIQSYYLVPFPKMAKHGRDIWSHWFTASFHPAAVSAPPVMAAVILLLACFNFTNTSIAFSSRRIKEIGVRKVAGGHRKQIMWQFLGENFIQSAFALLIGLFIARWLTGVYSSMWEYMELTMNFREDPLLIVYLVLLIIITTIIAGAYPSFYISKFNPVLIFQDKYKVGGKNILFLVLMGFNFLIAVNAIISGIYYYQNANYQENIYLGYDRKHIICVPFNNNASFEAYKNTIKENPVIQSIGESDEHINWSLYTRPIKYEDIGLEVSIMDIGHGYFQTMGLHLVEGREFEPDLEQSDRQGNVIVSKEFVKAFGIEDPLGKRITLYDTFSMSIIGVMEDLYLGGVWNKLEPTLLRLAEKERLRMMTVRASTENLKSVNEYLEKEWKELLPNYPYEGFFQEEMMSEAKSINKNIKNIYLFLAVVATLLSVVGLYSMVSLMVIRRTKEIGIRKVTGAETTRIIIILMRTFLIIITIATVFGLVTGYYLSRIMMESIWDLYADANLITFILPAVLIISLTLITMSGKIFEAASRNPAESLRYE